MADYFGLEAIARRMNVCQATVRYWLDHRDFLAYHRGGRNAWYTNDGLISIWEIAQASRSRQKRAAASPKYRTKLAAKRALNAPEPVQEQRVAHA